MAFEFDSISSLFTKEELERINNDDLFWWRVNEMGLLHQFNVLCCFFELNLEKGERKK